MKSNPRIIPDRDKFRNWYLDEDVIHTLHNGDTLRIGKGFRFDAHSVPFIFRWIFPKYSDDIYAALIHDFLGATAPWHRYNQDFNDTEYEILMDKYSTGIRRYWMPKAVRLWSFFKYTIHGDYRGEIKPNTTVQVTVDVV